MKKKTESLLSPAFFLVSPRHGSKKKGHLEMARIDNRDGLSETFRESPWITSTWILNVSYCQVILYCTSTCRCEVQPTLETSRQLQPGLSNALMFLSCLPPAAVSAWLGHVLAADRSLHLAQPRQFPHPIGSRLKTLNLKILCLCLKNIAKDSKNLAMPKKQKKPPLVGWP